MSDEHDDVTDSVEDAADDTVAGPPRPSGKRRSRGGRALLAESGDGAVESGGATLTKTRPTGESADTKSAAGRTETRSRNPFAAIWLYLRQVVAELRKVIWPNRRQMVVYTGVVLAFVIVMSAVVAGLDIGFAKLILWAFG
ncbi:preprotein translocase subunit SecE [Tsukamurella soli]|uniref:Protein translocase subunit SecE n=1 Tax=Tsukamurella soli TaxID=644556 RepID=A0ABP8KB22_9ACTN